jgi:hypothetical protein
MSRASYQDHRSLSFNHRKPVTKAQVIDQLDKAMDMLLEWQKRCPNITVTSEQALRGQAFTSMQDARRKLRIMVSK